MTHRTIIVRHRHFGFWFVPNQYAYVPHPDRGYYVVQTNSLGIRSHREYTRHKPPGTYRILLLGDSFTAADGVHNQERFSNVLEAMDDRLEVINFGLPASGTDQQLLVYENLARSFEADLLLLCPLVGNIERNVLRYRAVLDRTMNTVVFVPKPYFTLEQERLVLHHNPLPQEKYLYDEAPDAIKQTALSTGGVRFGRTPWGKLAFALDRLSGGAVRPVVQGAWALRKRLAGAQPYPSYDTPGHPAWRLMQAILERFIEEADGRATVLAPLPNYKYIEHFKGRPNYLARFQEVAQRGPRVGLVDVLAALRRRPLAQRQQFRFPSDVHYTPQAHAEVAAVLYEACLKEKVTAALGE